MPEAIKNENWTEAELDACVKVYIEMLSKEKHGLLFKKSEYRTQTLADALINRTAASFEY